MPLPKPPLRTALFQSSGVPGSVEGNIEVLRGAVERAAAAGAKLLITSELYLTGYVDTLPDLAEEATNATTEIAGIAKKNGVAVAYGYPEVENSVRYNSVRLIDSTGATLENYRKTHLIGNFEKKHFKRGDRPLVQAELHGLQIGFLICYDVEFPENVRTHLIADRPTDLLVVPTAVMDPFQIVPESVVGVRAFEGQMFIAYANRIGTEKSEEEEKAYEFVGRSTLAGPDGKDWARAGRGSEELIFADVDPNFLEVSRERNPYRSDRIPELYKSLVD